MLLSILKFFSAVWTAVFSALTSFVNWVRENPRLAAAIFVSVAVIVGSVYAGYNWAVSKTEAKYAQIIKEKNELISKYEADLQERDNKIKQVETDSKIAADKAAQDIAGKQSALDAASSEFKRKLAAEIAKRKADKGTTIIIKSPETNNPITVTVDKDEVICGRFHDAFLDSVNSMVNIVNSANSDPGLGSDPDTTPTSTEKGHEQNGN